MLSTLLMFTVVALAGWALASLLRAPAESSNPQADWEHWLEASGMRPVIPRTRPVAEATAACSRQPSEVERAAMGRAADNVLVVVAQLVTGETMIAAQRRGPVADPTHHSAQGWQFAITDARVDRAWEAAGWLRNGPVSTR